jgi:hypothetical protein
MLRTGIAFAGILAFTAVSTASAKPIPQRFEGIETAGVREQGAAPANMTVSKVSDARMMGNLVVDNALLQRNDGLQNKFQLQVGLNRSPSTNNGQKGNPALINMTMLIKMGSMHRAGADSENALSGTKKANPALLNTTMLIKMGGMHRSTGEGENALAGNKKANMALLNSTMLIKMGGMSRSTDTGKGAFSRTAGKGTPAMLNMTMLIKMGGSKRLFEGASTPNPNEDRASKSERADHGKVKNTSTKAERHTMPRGMSGLDHGRVNHRERVGNFRCSRGDCN